MKKLILLTLILLSLNIYAQISGQSAQGSADPKEFVPVGSKEQTGEVDLFSGTFGQTQNLGTVSTPTGLSFSLNLSYSSRGTVGQNMPFVDGIPYGEGWNLNLPFITVNTAALIKYSMVEQKDYENNPASGNDPDDMFSAYELKNSYGNLSWFSPYLNIPGVANGRLVFKYMREAKNNIKSGLPVFVLENFETYIEATFDGIAWIVYLPDGTKYSFNEILYTVTNPTNQRVSKIEGGDEVLATDNKIVGNLTSPNKSASSWYVTQISNPSKHIGYYISFQYKQYGAFNFHDYSGIEEKYLAAPRELFLQKISAIHNLSGFKIVNSINNEITTEYLELNYAENTALRRSNMAYPTKADCSMVNGDDLYVKEVIYKQGSFDGGQNINFNDWKRYTSPRQLDPANTDIDWTNNKYNPYLFTNNQSTIPYYARKNITNNSLSSLVFEHSFLESGILSQNNPQNNKFMPGGEIYEIDARVYNNSSTFCLFDINLVSFRSDEETTYPTSPFSGYHKITEQNYNQVRDNTIFSTFGQAQKYISSQSVTSFNQFFTMPALPSTLSNFVAQIGPANSDNDFSIKALDLASDFGGANFKVPATYFNHPAYTTISSHNDDDRFRLKTALRCPRNFGGGYPWYMIYQAAKSDIEVGPEMNTWWGTSPQWTPGFPNSHVVGATLANNQIGLKSFTINRYSKRPYVLQSVKHYVLNATDNSAHKDQVGDIYYKTLELSFDYDVMLLDVFGSTVASNTNYSSDALYQRYVIVLKEIKNNTDNSTSVPDEKRLKTRFSYIQESANKTTFTTQNIGVAFGGSPTYYSIEQLGKIVLLTKVESASGSIKEIEYYTQEQKERKNRLSEFQDINLWDKLAARNNQGGVFIGPSNTFEVAFTVKKVKEKVNNSEYLTIEYDFTDPIETPNTFPYTLPSTLPVKKEDGTSIDYNCEHFGQKRKVTSGYTYAIVNYGNPSGATNGILSKIKYTFSSNPRFFGKMLSSLSYTDNNSVITNLKKTEYDYEATKAYENGFVRWKRLGTIAVYMGTPPLLTSITPKNANVALEYDYSDYNSSFMTSSLYNSSNYYTVNAPAANTPGILNKSVATTDWRLWKEVLKATLNMGVHNDALNLPNISFNNTFRDFPFDYSDNSGLYASYFVKLKQIKTTNYEKDVSNNTISNVTVKDFKYYDADYKGLSTCKGFGYIKDDYTSSDFNLMYEPSWQLYSVKEYQENLPDQYTIKEKFYYYDLIQKYNVSNTNILGTTKLYNSSFFGSMPDVSSPYFISKREKGSLPDNNLLSNTKTYGIDNFMNNGLEAMVHSQYFGVRNLVMEERTSTSTKDGNDYDDYFKSNYYLYKKSDKTFNNQTFNKGTSSFGYTKIGDYFSTRFPFFPAIAGALPYWNNLHNGLTPYPVKKYDFPQDASDLDRAIAMYFFTGGYNNKQDIVYNIYDQEALVKKCFPANNTLNIDNSGELFKLVLQNVKNGLNQMYNVDLVPKIDNVNVFDINSDASVYTEFLGFPLEDFIPMAVVPNTEYTENEYSKLMSLEFEAVKALMCYAIQDDNLTTLTLINTIPDDSISQIVYNILSGKSLTEVRHEKELFQYVDATITSCPLPLHFLLSDPENPELYHIQPDRVFTQIDDGIAQEIQNKFPQLCIDNSYTILTPPERTKRPILHFSVQEILLSWTCEVPISNLPINDAVEPVFPYAVLKLNETTDINIFGNVSETKNELELQNKLTFGTYNRYLVYNNGVLTKIVLSAKNIGLPTQNSTIGDGKTYSKDFTYDNLNRLIKSKDENLLESETFYDNFSNITEIKLNGTTREKRDLSFFNFRDNNIPDFINTSVDKSGSNGTADYRSKYNYSEILNYTTDNSGVKSRTYYEPTGRTYQTVTQDVSSISGNTYTDIANYSGLPLYDKWGRVINGYKPFSAIVSGMSLTPDLLSVNASGLKTSLAYTDDLKSRTTESAPFGRDLGAGNHTFRTEHYLINGNTLLTELGLTSGTDNSKIKLLTNTIASSYTDFRFYKTVSYDADDKKTIVYDNIWGQTGATVTCPSSSTKSITINGYNRQGKLKQTISPNNISSYYSYNWQGNLIEKMTYDAGTVRYMYDQAGNVVLEQTEKMRNGEGHSMPYYRGYNYDKRGRLTKQYIANQAFDKNTAFFNVSNNSSHSLDPELKKNLPLTIDNANVSYPSYQNFAFLYQHYKYDNLNTYSWLYKKEYTLTNPNTVKYTLGIDDCLGDKIYEREWYYDAFPSNYETYFHSSIKTGSNLAYTRNHLLGKLALDVSYNSDYLTSVCPTSCINNKIIYMGFYSYDIEGKPEWEIQQFNENGIVSGNTNGEVVKIDYLSYLRNGTLQTRNVYLLNSSGTLEFKKQYYNTYDNKGRLSNLYLNNLSTDLQNGRKIATLNYNATFGFNESINYYRQACNTDKEVDKIEYDYLSDPQNRLTKISTTQSGFVYDLYYDANNPTTMSNGTITLPTGTTNYNGNINSTVTQYPTGITNFTQNYTYYGYAYDGNNRLTAGDALINTLNTAKGDENYTYDLSGNILTLNRIMVLSTDNFNYEYATGTNKLAFIKDQNQTVLRAYNYDKDGNTINRPFSGGQLNQMVYGRANLLYLIVDNNNQTTRYLYNTSNIRIHKMYGSTSEFYLYDISGEMLCVINRSTYDPIEWYAGNGKPLVKDDGTDLFNYIYDHLGNTRLVYKPVTINCGIGPPTTYNFTAVYDYFPYGKILRYNHSSQERLLSTGNERDPETGGLDGLDYRIARMYDGEIGRFLTCDPMAELRIEWSTYNYCRDNPVWSLDPNGMLDDWVQNSSTGEYEWMDNVTSIKNTPKGYRYIGSQDKDILNDLHLNYTPKQLRSNIGGQLNGDFEEGRYAANTYASVDIYSRINIFTDVSYNFSGNNKNNKLGRKFEGIIVEGVMESKSSRYQNVKRFWQGDSKESDPLFIDAGLRVEYGGKVYTTSFSKPSNVWSQTNYELTTARISIPSSNLSQSNNLSLISISGQIKFDVDGNLYPLLSNALVPTVIRLNHEWTFPNK